MNLPATLRVLRVVDGWGHVLVGPPLLAAARPVAAAVGLPAGAVRTFLGGFVAYGGYVLYRTRTTDTVTVTELVPLALAVNVGFVGLCAAAWRTDGLTPLGRAAAANGIATGSAMAALLATALVDDRR